MLLQLSINLVNAFNYDLWAAKFFFSKIIVRNDSFQVGDFFERKGKKYTNILLRHLHKKPAQGLDTYAIERRKEMNVLEAAFAS